MAQWAELKGRRVLVWTYRFQGHLVDALVAAFRCKGMWLRSLPDPTRRHRDTNLASQIDHIEADIRDYASLQQHLNPLSLRLYST